MAFGKVVAAKEIRDHPSRVVLNTPNPSLDEPFMGALPCLGVVARRVAKLADPGRPMAYLVELNRAC